VYIIADNLSNRTFKIAVDDAVPAFEYTKTSISRQVAEVSDARHAYLTSTVKELLDAAHIIPDNMPEGKSTIENGLSLCKLHHSTYDAFIIGVTPDYIIQVREDILEEEDGPVLQHGLKGLHKSKLILPSMKSHYLSKEALEWRYSRFTRAG
jgi:predicted restriction endonuclease